MRSLLGPILVVAGVVALVVALSHSYRDGPARAPGPPPVLVAEYTIPVRLSLALDELDRALADNRPPNHSAYIEMIGAAPGALGLDCAGASRESMVRARSSLAISVAPWVRDTGEQFIVSVSIAGMADGLKFKESCLGLRALHEVLLRQVPIRPAGQAQSCNEVLAEARSLKCYMQILPLIRSMLTDHGDLLKDGRLIFLPRLKGETHPNVDPTRRGAIIHLRIEWAPAQARRRSLERWPHITDPEAADPWGRGR